MRQSTIFLLALVSSFAWIESAGADEMQWLNSIEQARQIAAQSQKMVLVHFWSRTCAPCVQLDRNVYSQAGIGQEISAAFVPVKVNTEQYPAVAQQYQVQYVPTDVIMAADGRVLSRQNCPLNRAEYISGLARVAFSQRAQQQGPYANVASLGAQGLAGSANQTRPGVVTGQQAPTYPAIQQHAADAAPFSGSYADYAAQSSAGRITGVTEQPQAVGQPHAANSHPPTVNANPYAGYQPYVPPGAVEPGYVPPTPAIPAGTPMADPYTNLPGTVPMEQPSVGLHSPTSPPFAAQTLGPPTVGQPSFTLPPREQYPVAQPPVGQPPLALDGSCPVELIENERWVRGDSRWGAVHRGRLYLFGGEAQMQRFMSNPDYYSPVLSGHDSVIAIDRQQMMPGLRQHGVFYNRRVYLFASEDTLAQFYNNASRYADGVRQAETAGQLPLR